MKKLFAVTALALLACACMFKPLPEIPTLGDITLPLVAEEETLWKSTDYKGKPVLVVFMGSWCPYCKMSMPAVQATKEKFGDKVEVVAIFIDSDAEKVKEVIKSHNFTEKALFDGGQVAESMEVNGLPHAIVFDKKHRVINVWEGFSPTRADDFNAALEKLTK